VNSAEAWPLFQVSRYEVVQTEQGDTVRSELQVYNVSRKGESRTPDQFQRDCHMNFIWLEVVCPEREIRKGKPPMDF
jgi:hypothetical protein